MNTSCSVRTMLILAFAFHSAARADEVDRYISHAISSRSIPGLSVAVVHDGKLVKAGGYGLANLELDSRATAETAYEIGSITKQFTAQAVMLLVEDGKLGLDDTLGRRLDGLPEAWKPLTLRQLLTHTSGLKDWESAGLLSFHREYSDAEFMGAMGSYALDFPPGERWSYSNTAYPLLGMVVSRVSGMPYDQFVAVRIFQPLGMRASRFSHPLEIVPHRASGYVDEAGHLRKGELLRPRVVEPNGGILTSVLDLAKWARAFDAGVLLTASSLQQIQTPVRLNDGTTFKSGLGLFVDEFRGHRLWVHNGSTPGGFSSVFYHYPDDRLSVFVLCNIDRDDAVNHVATRVASFYVPGLDLRSLPENKDPDPRLAAGLLTMLRDIADRNETTLMLPARLGRVSERTRIAIKAHLDGMQRLAFLERDEHPGESSSDPNSVSRLLRYKLVRDAGAVFYTFEMTANGKVADLSFEED